MTTAFDFEIKSPRYPSRQCLFIYNGKQCENESEPRKGHLLCPNHKDEICSDLMLDLCINWERQKYEASNKETFHKKIEEGVTRAFNFVSDQEEFIPSTVYVDDKGRFVFPDGKKYVIKLVEEKDKEGEKKEE